MNDFQREKGIVRRFHEELDRADSDPAKTLARHCLEDFVWRGYHPFGEQDVAGCAKRFWRPLKRSLGSMQRRLDIFFAGTNEIDDHQSVWVVSMGHLMGLFDHPWLGIRPTGKIVMLRFCEFNRVTKEGIAESAMFFDIPHLMMQAGQYPFPPQSAAQLVQPGPATHDGLVYEAKARAESEATLSLINKMIRDIGQWQGRLSLEDELRRTWSKQMIWWGPAGIGATYTIERYAKQHAGPFRAGFIERSPTTHRARLAEGHYGGFFGWPNFTVRPAGGFMGLPPSDERVEFRVIDIYRREGDRLVENWIFIDLLHLWQSQGVQLLEPIDPELPDVA
ncbi:MAG: ester cyclase [Ectothiorhodospiraceae bacterium AqS1]|nr:ester cyclase [Ectothiorhodospiraceae bacterium AqS1]